MNLKTCQQKLSKTKHRKKRKKKINRTSVTLRKIASGLTYIQVAVVPKGEDGRKEKNKTKLKKYSQIFLNLMKPINPQI